MTVRELLSEEKKWTKGNYAKDDNGFALNYHELRSSRAVCWCLSDAIDYCYDLISEQDEARNKIAELIGDNITGFNDNEKTTFADIRRVIEEARI